MDSDEGFQITDDQRRVLATLRAADYAPLPVAEIARRAGMPEDTALKSLQSLDMMTMADHWPRENMWLISHVGWAVCDHQNIGARNPRDGEPTN